MLSPISVAVVGLGWVATARHIPALLRQPGFKLHGVIDRDPAKAAALAARHNLPRHTGGCGLRDVPWLDEIEAVTIAAPPFAHHDLVCAALAAGKHVLTEKPFAMTPGEGEAMLEAAAQAQRQLAVVHNFQFARAAQKLWRDLAQGRLGTVRWIAARQLGNPRRRLPAWYRGLPLGLFYDESPHFYYLLRRLTGDLVLQDAVARGRQPDDATPDEIRLLYRGAQGIPVSIDCNFQSPLSEWHIAVGGTAALGILDIFRDFYYRLPQDGVHGLPQILRTSLYASAQHWAQYGPNGLNFLRGRLDYGNDGVMRRFLTACRANQPAQDISAADAQAVLRLQQGAAQAVRWL